MGEQGNSLMKSEQQLIGTNIDHLSAVRAGLGIGLAFRTTEAKISPSSTPEPLEPLPILLQNSPKGAVPVVFQRLPGND